MYVRYTGSKRQEDGAPPLSYDRHPAPDPVAAPQIAEMGGCWAPALAERTSCGFTPRLKAAARRRYRPTAVFQVSSKRSFNRAPTTEMRSSTKKFSGISEVEQVA